MDEDIAKADELGIARINTQAYRDQIAIYGADVREQFKKSMAVELAAKYFTTSTATDLATVVKDAKADRVRFEAALREALAGFDAVV